MSSFFADSLDHGDAPALIDEHGTTLSYVELARRADALAVAIGATPRLVLLEAHNSVDTIVAIVAALRGRHPLIVATEATRGRIEAAFAPDVIIDGHGVRRERGGTPAMFHPDLALMLSTSGSTGATKLVRLSRAAIDANARSIAEYLRIAADDRALTTLPVSYSYGLSVVTSHLAAGAAIVLSDHSVVDDALWALAETQRITSLAGVPYTYELLEATGFRERAPTSLRTMTQAGGRLSPDLVATYGRWARENDIRFYTMYGQTEATARMAYLPPELADGHSDCIGIAIPGGALRLIDPNGHAVPQGSTGELVYTGANVMMGYATEAADLARGAELTELRTGDLAQEVDDGLFRIVGRSSRFSKIAGLRVGLDEIEAMLAENGIAATVAGDDELVAIGIRNGDLGNAARVVEDRTAIPLRSRIVFALAETPRLLSGKVDYPAILGAGRAAHAAADAAAGTAASDDAGGALALVFTRALNRRGVGPDDSFNSLGGDSLAYVEISMAIERTLGHLPDEWERLTIGQIATLAASRSAVPAKRRFRVVASEMLIRPVAMTTIILGHAMPMPDALLFKGGALALLMTAGYNSARFQRDQMIAPGRWNVLGQFALRFLIPYYLVMLIYQLSSKTIHLGPASLFLYSSYVRDPGRGNLEVYWFMEVLFHALILLVVLFAIPPVRRFAVRQRWWFGLALVVGVVIAKIWLPLLIPIDQPWRPNHRLDFWAYAFFIGWLMTEADTLVKRLTCVVLAVGLSGWTWGFGELHNIYLTASVVLILFVPRVKLWSPAASTMAFLSQATFYIYLAHGVAINIISYKFGYKNIFVIVAASFAIGIVAMFAWRFVIARTTRLFSRDDPGEAVARSSAI